METLQQKTISGDGDKSKIQSNGGDDGIEERYEDVMEEEEEESVAGYLIFIYERLRIEKEYKAQPQAVSQSEKDEEINDTPIEEVRLTVPITDDSTLPVLTFRTWVVAPIICILLAVYSSITEYRQVPLSVPTDVLNLLFIPIGKLMAAKLPTRPITVPFTNWTFSMNPGPFNIKEHVVLTIFACYSGMSNSIGPQLVTIEKAFFHKAISFWGSFLLIQTSQMMGYGITGVFMKYLVKNPYMWWPGALPDVTYYKTFHELELRPKGKLTRIQFFMIVTVSSFAYYIIPSYFFPSISSLSILCWIWKDSVTAQQIGSGLHGLGVGAFPLDWSSITGYAGDPLVIPMFAIVNIMVGVILVAYIIGPIGYWTNSYGVKRFPFLSTSLFDVNGQVYNDLRILNDDMTLNLKAYNNYSPMYMSIFMLCSTGFSFAAETATLTHFILHHARETWKQFWKGYKGVSQFNDVHNRLMNKYESIPQWWFYIIIVSTIVFALLNSFFFGKQFQVPYWVVLLGYVLPFVLILPVGIVQATTGQKSISMKELSQLIIGLIYPGNPLGNLAFQSYTSATMMNSLGFLLQFKSAHYMKIPPKSLFIAQVVGSFISNSASLGTQWWILTKIDNICDKKKLPEGSPWTCPFEHVEFAKAMIWGAVGPRRMFSPHGQYSNMYIFYLVGVISTVVMWIITRMFPEKKWIKLIHIPLILISATSIPPAAPMHYWAFFTVGIIFNGIVFQRCKEWWGKYNYLLASGLGMGPSLIGILTTLALNLKDVYGVQWWGLLVDDHCPLASCPTAPGVMVDGCPVF